LSLPLQRVWRLRVPRRRHRRRGDRHEVAVPFRVLSGGEVARSLGSWRPVRPWRSRRAVLPVFLPLPGPKDATPWAFPLVGFSPPSRCCPKLLPPASRPAAPLMGFRAPTTHGAGRAHVQTSGCPSVRLPRSYRGGPPAVPSPPATVSLAGFPNLSATCLSPRRPAIFRRVAFVGFALQGVFLA
jgi:hypothetical protein